MTDKPPKENVTKNTDLEYESQEVSPHSEMPDDFVPENEKDQAILNSIKGAKDLAKLKEDLKKVEALGSNVDSMAELTQNFDETLKKIKDMGEMLQKMTKKFN